MPNSASHSKLLTPEEVSERLGIPRSTLYFWRQHGKGPRAKKVGRHLRYEESELQRWIDSRPYEAA